MLRSILTLLLGASSLAQTCIYTGPVVPGGSANGAGLLATADPGAQVLYRRTHILIDAAVFANVPLLIRDLSIAVKSGWQRARFPQLTIRMGHTTQVAPGLTFAQNITSPLQDVLVANDYVIFEGVGPAWVPVGLQQPFHYSPGLGNLLIELVQVGGETLEVGAGMQFADSTTGVGHASGWSLSLPTQGQSVYSAPALRFCVDQGGSTLLGASCPTTVGNPPLLGLTGQSSLGGQMTFWLSTAPANSLAFLAFGFDNSPPYPVNLASLGATGCKQYFPIAFSAPIVTDGYGVGTHTMAIPLVSGAIGQIVLGQYATLVPAANSLGVLTSNYGRVSIGQ